MATTENFDVLEKAVAISFADLVSRYRMRLQSCPSTLSVVVESELQGLKASLGQGRLTEQRAEEWRKQRKMEEIRRTADEAWRAGRYRDVVALYESIASQLTPSEAKKLMMARKRIESAQCR